MAAESDHLLFASGRDRALLAARRESMPPTTILPNGVDVDFWQRRPGAWSRYRRVRRRDALWPQRGCGHLPHPDDHADRAPLATRCPATIVGRDPRRRLIAAARGQPNVELTGFVTDMRDHLERASVVVAALRYATGIQNKILEAMAMAVPVVTTPVAEAGLSVAATFGHPSPSRRTRRASRPSRSADSTRPITATAPTWRPEDGSASGSAGTRSAPSSTRSSDDPPSLKRGHRQ